MQALSIKKIHFHLARWWNSIFLKTDVFHFMTSVLRSSILRYKDGFFAFIHVFEHISRRKDEFFIVIHLFGRMPHRKDGFFGFIHLFDRHSDFSLQKRLPR